MARYTKPQPKVYQADDVWAAACAAQRINGAYLKATTEDGKVANRTLVLDLLADTSKITDADREQGEDVRRYYKSLTFKLISGDHLSEFDNTALKIAQTDMIFSTYDIAVITSLPSCSERGRQRDAINNRIKFEGGGFIGTVGSKVTVDLEVLKCITEIKEIFLTAHCMLLASDHAGNYVVVAPESQTQYAIDTGVKAITKEMKKMAMNVSFTKTELLTDTQRAKNSDAQAKISMLAGMMNKEQKDLKRIAGVRNEID